MKIVKEFILREIAGECVLVPTGDTTQEFNGLITLTETAKFIWEHIEDVNSFEELVDLMLNEYDVEQEIVEKDAAIFVSRLLDEGFIELTKADRSW